MKIYIDYAKRLVTKVEKADIHFGDDAAETIELVFSNYDTKDEWYVGLSAEMSNRTTITPRAFDTDGRIENEDGTLSFQFTLSQANGWYLVGGKTTFYAWVIYDNKNYCIASFFCNILASSGFYMVDDPILNPKLKQLINDDISEAKTTLTKEMVQTFNDKVDTLYKGPKIIAYAYLLDDFTEDDGVYVAKDDGYWYSFNDETGKYEQGLKFMRSDVVAQADNNTFTGTNTFKALTNFYNTVNFSNPVSLDGEVQIQGDVVTSNESENINVKNNIDMNGKRILNINEIMDTLGNSASVNKIVTALKNFLDHFTITESSILITSLVDDLGGHNIKMTDSYTIFGTDDDTLNVKIDNSTGKILIERNRGEIYEILDSSVLKDWNKALAEINKAISWYSVTTDSYNESVVTVTEEINFNKTAAFNDEVDFKSNTVCEGDVTVRGGLNVETDAVVKGNLVVKGTTITVDTENLEVSDALIKLAKDNKEPLTQLAGVYVPKYDGENSGALVFDSTGTAYVGDAELGEDGTITAIGDMQPLATRDSEENINDEELMSWDAKERKMVGSGFTKKSISDLPSKDDVSNAIQEAINNLGYAEEVSY